VGGGRGEREERGSAGYRLIYTNAPGTYLTLTKAPAQRRTPLAK